jgi:hypothetical protein
MSLSQIFFQNGSNVGLYKTIPTYTFDISGSCNVSDKLFAGELDVNDLSVNTLRINTGTVLNELDVNDLSVNTLSINSAIINDLSVNRLKVNDLSTNVLTTIQGIYSSVSSPQSGMVGYEITNQLQAPLNVPFFNQLPATIFSITLTKGVWLLIPNINVQVGSPILPFMTQIYVNLENINNLSVEEYYQYNYSTAGLSFIGPVIIPSKIVKPSSTTTYEYTISSTASVPENLQVVNTGGVLSNVRTILTAVKLA